MRTPVLRRRVAVDSHFYTCPPIFNFFNIKNLLFSKNALKSL